MPYTPNYSYYPNTQPYGQSYPAQGNVYAPVAQNPAQGVLNAVRSVYSEAEARAAQIPTDGSTIVFFDQSTGKIYTKQFSFENGSFLFATYTQQAEQAPVKYATLDDLEKLREELTRKKGKKDEE